MKPKRRKNGKSKPKIIMTSSEIAVCYIATLILAGFIANSGLDSSAVWGFLGTALALLLRIHRNAGSD